MLHNVCYFVYRHKFTPPKTTTQNILCKTDFFCSLENSILKYKGKGNIVIMGDLNAQTRTEDHSHRK